MLKKPNRLPATQKLKTSSFCKTPTFSVRISKNNLPDNRFGFIVKKAIDKRAVTRNRIRRVFRSCIEEMFAEIKSGHDMLFFLEKGIIDRKRELILKDIHSLLFEKGLLK